MKMFSDEAIKIVPYYKRLMIVILFSLITSILIMFGSIATGQLVWLVYLGPIGFALFGFGLGAWYAIYLQEYRTKKGKKN